MEWKDAKFNSPFQQRKNVPLGSAPALSTMLTEGLKALSMLLGEAGPASQPPVVPQQLTVRPWVKITLVLFLLIALTHIAITHWAPF